MTVAVWQPGAFYNPGALVFPQTAPPIVTGELENPNFEEGNTGWDKTVFSGTQWVITTGTGYNGTGLAQYPAPGTGTGYIINDTVATVTPGQSITGNAALYADGSPSLADLGVSVRIRWYTAANVFISEDFSPFVGGNSTWYYVSVTGTAPANAAKARLCAFAYRNSGPHNIYVDAFSWDYSIAPPPAGLIYRAVQADAGFSGNTEPTWPTVLGNTVVDNQVTWQAVLTTRVTWEASPILVSGDYEPTFPAVIGGAVADNTITWRAVSRRIEDSKCPNTIPTAIGASKVFSADDDIIAFTATINPLDWSSSDDAGYLPFGLQTYGSQPVTAMGLFRGNLVAFNATGFQMWQIDQDPANMTLLDAVPISCTYPRTVQPLSNDLIFLNAKGVRNIAIAAASTNLQANGVGEPVDPLVRAKVVADQYEPIGLYWPYTGQYWLIFGDEAFVLTINGSNKKSWSRYQFPAVITDWTLDGNDLVLRAVGDEDGDLIWRMDAETTIDDAQDPVAVFTAGGPVGRLALVTIQGTGNRVQTSDNGGASWATQSAVDNNWNSICWSPELALFVAVASSGTSRVMTSPDGFTWTTRTAPSSNWASVCWSPELSLFVAVSSFGATRVMTSPDGITWTTRTAGLNALAVCWSPELGLFCAAVASTSFITSPDGVTWTLRTVPVANTWNGICWSPELNLFCAVATNGTNRALTSPDGINWTERATPANITFYDICWSSDLGIFVAVGQKAGGTDAIGVMTSPNGTSWTARTGTDILPWASVLWAPELELFVAVGGDTSTSAARIMTSPDGSNWTARTPAASLNITGVAWAPGLVG